MPLNIAITNEQKILVTLAPTTAAGNPAPLDGAPVWTVAEGDVTLEVAEDGLSAYIISGVPGSSLVSISADADMDAGEERQISDVIAVTVVPAEAATMGLSAGSPEQK